VSQYHFFLINEEEKFKLQLEEIADTFSDRSDQFIVNGYGNLQALYFLHRKGWALSDEEIMHRYHDSKFKNMSAEYLYVDKRARVSKLKTLPYPVVYENEELLIYSLRD
jgi:hypothetical protein